MCCILLNPPFRNAFFQDRLVDDIWQGCKTLPVRVAQLFTFSWFHCNYHETDLSGYTGRNCTNISYFLFPCIPTSSIFNPYFRFLREPSIHCYPLSGYINSPALPSASLSAKRSSSQNLRSSVLLQRTFNTNYLHDSSRKA